LIKVKSEHRVQADLGVLLEIGSMPCQKRSTFLLSSQNFVSLTGLQVRIASADLQFKGVLKVASAEMMKSDSPGRATGAGGDRGEYKTLHWLKYRWKFWRSDALAKITKVSFSA
jgi:hypothetical protein